MANFSLKKVAFLALLLAMQIVTGCNGTEETAASKLGNGSVSIQASGIYRDSFNLHAYEKEKKFEYTPIGEDDVLGYHGAFMHFIFRNQTNENRVIEGVYIEIQEIALDTSPFCRMQRYSDDQGNLIVQPMNVGWGEIPSGVLTFTVPAEYQQFFRKTEYIVETDMLAFASLHSEIILLRPEDIVKYPEEEQEITISWVMETATGKVSAYNEEITFQLGTEGILSYLNVFGLEDPPYILFNPSLEESSFFKDDKIALPAQTSVGLFTRVGAMQSCHVVAEFIFTLDDGSEYASGPIEASFRNPVVSKESQEAIRYSTVFRPLRVPEDWAVISPIDETSIIMRN